MAKIERLIAFITARRHELGLSQRDLAKQAGINPGTLSSIEAGKVTRAPTIRTLEKLAKGLAVPSEVLVAVISEEGSSAYPVSPAEFDTPVAAEGRVGPLDAWEQDVLKKVVLLDLHALQPEPGSMLWQVGRSARRRILRHLEALWEEQQDYLARREGDF